MMKRLPCRGLLQQLSRAEGQGAEAAIIACFDDTGLDAARGHGGHTCSGVSVSLLLRSPPSLPNAIPSSRPWNAPAFPIEDLVRRYGHAERCKVRAADIPVLSLEDPNSMPETDCAARLPPRSLRIGPKRSFWGCAGMAELAASLQAEFGLPVIDGWSAAAVKQAEALTTLGLATSKGGVYAPPVAKPYHGLLEPFCPRTDPKMPDW